MSHRILIVDEEEDAIRQLEAFLQVAGYETVVASRFDQAKRLLVSDPPSLLIAAVRLGAFNGLHLILRARLDHPEIAAIITSEHADSVLESEAQSYGASYLAKPFDREALLALVSKLLSTTAA
jgi:DNA-binding response OmpR family regulator